MNKKHSFNIVAIICVIVAVYMICCLLLQDDLLPFSISSMITCINHWAKHWHVLTAGLIPIYVAFMIFGTAILGICLGSIIHRWIAQRLTKNDS